MRTIVVLCCKVPDVPLIVTVAPLSIFAVALAVSVKVLAPLPLTLTLLGLKDAVTPLGRPEALRFTVPAKLPIPATRIVLDAPVPWVMLKILDEAESAKLFDMIANTVPQPKAPPCEVVP